MQPQSTTSQTAKQPPDWHDAGWYSNLPPVSLFAQSQGWPLCLICDRPVSPWNQSFCAGHFPHPVLRGDDIPLHYLKLRCPWHPPCEYHWQYPGTPARRALKGRGVFHAIKAAIPVEMLASRFTELRRSGPNTLKGKCPLHDERSGSFVIYEDSQHWHCFGACARGGDVIELARLLMDKGLLK